MKKIVQIYDSDENFRGPKKSVDWEEFDYETFESSQVRAHKWLPSGFMWVNVLDLYLNTLLLKWRIVVGFIS